MLCSRDNRSVDGAQRRNKAVWRVGAAVAFVAILGALFVSHRPPFGSTQPAGASTQPAGSATADPRGWFRVSDHGLSFAVPLGTLVNPSTCLTDGRAYVLTTAHRCKLGPDRPVKPAPVVIWMHAITNAQPPRGPGANLLRTIDSFGLSGFVTPMTDPGFIPQTRGSTYTWILVETKSHSQIDIFGNRKSLANDIISSLRPVS